MAILILLASTPAFAKTTNFATGIPFGLGFAGGFEPKLSTDFAGSPSSASSEFGHYFLFEPYFDLINVVLRLSVGYHFYPTAGGPGSDSHGGYTESSKAGSLDWGARLLLAPLVSKDMRGRLFLALGVQKADFRLKNSRAYASGVSYTEHVSGSATALSVGVGAEEFLMQNYSLQLEAGYTQREAGQFKYDSANDDSGAAQTTGTTATNPLTARNKTVHLWGPYLQLALNLNF